MKVLALDTSARDFSVALLDNQQILDEHPATSGMSASRELIPTIQRMLQKFQWQVSDLELISLPIGPGSFSGLRIGVVVAKTLAYARSIPVIGVNTLEVVASQCVVDAMTLGLGNISAAIDAQRKELFVQTFQVKLSHELRPINEVEIISQSAFAAGVQPNCLFTGEGLTAIIDEIADRKPLMAPECKWRCTAAAAGILGLKKYLLERNVDFWSLQPNYYRTSAAEEKRIERSARR